MTETNYTELDAAIANLGLTYEAAFVPFSKSRNAKPIKKLSDLSLNWKVKLTKGTRTLTTDYMQGIAHVPGYRQTFGNNGLTVDEESRLKYACEQGKVAPAHRMGSLRPETIPIPLLRDVMHSLVLDSDVLDAGGFEEWASNFGYDTDSRQAETIYRQCIDIALKLRGMIGEAGLEAMRNAFQDY